MATLLLTAAGTALGGQLGGAIGGLLGQAVDRQLFGSPKGPKLGDLSVQTSSYGTAIPRIYGRMRVAGTVVWATDLKEQASSGGGVKGAAGTAYSANLVVALSSRPILDVGRIWADGKLVRGADGDFKVRTGFRLHSGHEDQPVDALVASVDTIGRATAFRGLALAVFDDLDLAEFGNRIPQLTFEVVADEAEPGVGQLLRDASRGAISTAGEQALKGFAAHGPSQFEGLAGLVEAFGIELIEAEGGLKGVQPASAVEIGQFELGCSIDDRRVPRVETSRSSSSKLPGEVSIRYYDATRDYQAGQARTVGSAAGARCIAMELPAVLAASDAKAMAERLLARSWSGGSKVRLRLPPFRMDLRPGAIVRLPGSRRCWTIRSIEIEGLAVSVEAEELVAPPVPAAADPGIALSGPDLPIGRTILSLLELPAPGSGESVELLVTAACAGAWKPAPVELDLGGAPLPPVAIVRPSRMGQAETVLQHGGSSLLDLRGSVVIRLADPGSHLFHADDAAMMAGANLAVLGRELIQFGRADELEPGLYRLSRLLRGRRGTEWAASGHGAGDDFVLVEEACAVPVNLPASSIGASLKATARGVADKPPLPFAQRLLTGESLRPPSPCHLTARSLPEGLRIEWVGRSASAWHWIDGEIAPAQHGYRLRLSGPAGDRLLAANEDWIQCDWSLVPAAPADELNISVIAVGPLASSHPATASFVL